MTTPDKPARHPLEELPELSRTRVLREAVGAERLDSIVDSYLRLLGTQAVIFEADGDYAAASAAAPYCGLLARASRALCSSPDHREACRSGAWHCHESCWTHAAKHSVETGEAIDVPCLGGLNIYSVPIAVDGKVLGALAFGYGAPPQDPAEQETIARRYGLDVDEVRRAAQSYRIRPQGVVDAAKAQIKVLADCVAELYRRRRAEIALQETEHKLRDHADRLLEADRRKDEFLAMLSHELRNPLTPIRNAVDLLRLRHRSADPSLQIIERQLSHMTHLVDELLDVARITRGHIELKLETLDLRDIVASAVELMEWRKKGLAVNVSVPDRAVAVQGDRTRLLQVLGNLLDNAVRYTPSGGTIGLCLRVEDHEALLEITDSGAGITPDMLPHVFDLFVQGKAPLNRPEGGLGLGLTLAHRLVTMHGGDIQAYSEGAGRGSTFTIRLPLTDTGAVRPQDSTQAPTRSLPSCRRILVVDDNHDVATSFCMLLESMGHEVQVAYQGEEALQTAERWRPEVIFLDIGLPGMDGFEVCTRLRERLGASVLIVAMTGYGCEEDKLRARQAGFDHHMLKPGDFEVLERWINEWEPKKDVVTH